MRRNVFSLAAMIATLGVGFTAADAADFAAFSIRGESVVRTLDDRGGSLVQGTLLYDQTLANAVRTEDRVLFSINEGPGTRIIDPTGPGGAAADSYSSRNLGLAEAGGGIAVGNLIDADTGDNRFYRLAPGGPSEVTFREAEALAVSNGKALMSASNGRYTYDITSDTISGNLGQGYNIVEGAGDSGLFATDLFGQTQIVDDGYANVSTRTSNDLVGAFSSRDILFLNIDEGNDGADFLQVQSYDTRTGSGVGFTKNGQQLSHLVAIGGTNFVFYSLGGSTSFYDPDDLEGDGDEVTSGSFSGQELVSGFSFGDYAVLGLRSTDGSAGRTIVMDVDGLVTTLAVSSGNDDAAWVTGAGVSYVPIPEPASLTLLSAGGLLLVRTRR